MNPNPDDQIAITAVLLNSTLVAQRNAKVLSKDIKRLTASIAKSLEAINLWGAGKSKKYPLRHLQKIATNSSSLELVIEALELMRDSIRFTEKQRNKRSL